MHYLDYGHRLRISSDSFDLTLVSPARASTPRRVAARSANYAAGLVAAAMLLGGHGAHAATVKSHPHRTVRATEAEKKPQAESEDPNEQVAFANGQWQLSGTASYYGPRHHGHRTAEGGIFNQYELTAAHPWLPFGTRVLVTAVDTGRQVVVTITDRMPHHRRLIDLSVAAARELGMIGSGVAAVVLTPADV